MKRPPFKNALCLAGLPEGHNYPGPRHNLCQCFAGHTGPHKSWSRVWSEGQAESGPRGGKNRVSLGSPEEAVVERKRRKANFDHLLRLSKLEQIKARERAYRLANKEKISERGRAYLQRPGVRAHQQRPEVRGKRYEKQKRYVNRYPDKRWAHKKVQAAIRRGLLIRQPCNVCGNPQSHAHHEDYAKPLDVIWLCSPCHVQLHVERRSAA